MRTVKYSVTGTRQPNVASEGTVRELISVVGSALIGKYIPPLRPMNQFFKRGHLSNGYNGDTYWEPFELPPGEYDRLVDELLADKDAGYQALAAPDWVETEIDWTAFTSWHELGVPIEPHRQMLYDMHNLIDEHAKAVAEGNRTLAVTLSVRIADGANRMIAYLQDYCRGDT